MSIADLLFQHPPLVGTPHLVFGDVDAPVVPVKEGEYDDGQLHGDLLFQRPPTNGNADLVFGDTGDAQPPADIDPVTLTGHNTLTGLRCSGAARVVVTLQASTKVTGLRCGGAARVVVTVTGHNTLTGLAGHVNSVYDNNVTRYLQGTATGQHNPAVPVAVSVSALHGVSQSQRGGTDVPWQTAAPQVKAVDSQHGLAIPQRLAAESAWQLAASHKTAAQARYQVADKRVARVSTGYNLAQSWQRLTTSGMQTGIPLRNYLHASWQPADHRQHLHTGRSGASLRRWGRQFEVARWQQAMRPPTGRSLRPVTPPKPPCYLPDANLVFDAPWSASGHLVFVCETHTPGGTPQPGATVVVPILRTYVTINSISLRRVDGDIPIPTFAFQMSLDADSWTWSWSATLPADALALIQPGSNGDPVEVEALVNGVPYRLCAESVGSQREFGQHRISVRGRGKAALLDAPYAPVINHGNAGPRTAQQLMTDVLTVNGVGIGWAVDWQLTDWLVPGNTWTHQGVYISAVLNIAQAAGGYVQPHRTDPTLRILPRYPAAPWAWGSVTPDFELPAEVVSLEGIDWQRKPDYSRIYVSGTRNGVLGQVTRAGTAGNLVAPMVVDPLITHADAARQRGLAELSDAGTQASVKLTLPVLAATGLIQPGQFVRYVDAGQSRVGLVRATSLAWSRPVMRQTIALETHI